MQRTEALMTEASEQCSGENDREQHSVDSAQTSVHPTVAKMKGVTTYFKNWL